MTKNTRKTLPLGWLLAAGFLCLGLFLSNGGGAAVAQSELVPVKLAHCVELEIPKGWRLLEQGASGAIETSVDAAMDLSGLEPKPGKIKNLAAATSVPRTSYAALRVNSTMPPSMTLTDLLALQATDVAALQNKIHQNLTKALPAQGNKLIDFRGVRVATLAGHATIVTEYSRTGPSGPVFVQINQIMTPTQEIGVNLSYQESDAQQWMPVMGEIRGSIVVKRFDAANPEQCI